jgi:peptidoglycan hydrolase CwlO-like protein
MCKKLVIAAVAILVGTAVVRHTSLGSLAQVWWHDAAQAVARQVPPEQQIKRLTLEVSKIDRDIRSHVSRLAEKEVKCEQMETNLARLKDEQAHRKADISAMTESFNAKADRVSFNGRSYRAVELTNKLDKTVSEFESGKAQVKSLEQILAAKRQELDNYHARIAKMRSQKDELQAAIAEFEAKLAQIRLAATSGQVDNDIDDSQVARCNALASEIRNTLDIADRDVKLQQEFGLMHGQPKIENTTKPTAEVLKAAKKALEEGNERVVDNDNKE